MPTPNRSAARSKVSFSSIASAFRRSPLSFLLSLAILGFMIGGCGRSADLAEARDLVERGRQTLEQAREPQGPPQEARALFDRAGDMFVQARTAYLSAGADTARDVEVLIEFARLAERLEDYDLAGEAYYRAAQRRPESAEFWYRAGLNFAQAGGRYADPAIEALEAARERMEIGGTDTVGLHQVAAALGKVYWNQRLIELAEEAYLESLGGRADYSPARMGLAAVALVQGDPVAASELLDNLQIVDESDARELDRMLREAYLQFRRDRAGIPNTAAAHRALAMLAVRLGYLEEARLAIERSLTLDGMSVFSWNLAGSLARQAGDIERAREAFERSLSLDPDQPRTREALESLTQPSAN